MGYTEQYNDQRRILKHAKPATLMFSKVIYNYQNKTVGQVQQVLQNEADQLKKLHPDYVFVNVSAEPIDKYGSCTHLLHFKLTNNGKATPARNIPAKKR